MVLAQWFSGGGLTVTIRSDERDPVTRNWIVSRYMHLFWGPNNIDQRYRPTPMNPTTGQGGRVAMGNRIGLVGDTGSPGAYHLHLDFNRNNLHGQRLSDHEHRPYLLNPRRFFPHITFTHVNHPNEICYTMP